MKADFRDNKLILLQIALLSGVSLLLRLVNLGYSDFQGDEILTLCRYTDYSSLHKFISFILQQKKGPLQYLLTCAYSIFDPKFSSEFALRLPFALVNLLALICLFILVYRLFTLEIAIYSGFLFATNGIILAFARIVQYQSFVILGGLIGILGLVLSLREERWRVPGLYLSSLFAAMSLLAHFDATFFIPPMMVLVVHWWLKFRGQPGFARLRMHLFAAGAILAFLVLGFYSVYALRLGPSRVDYWQSRMVGDTTNFVRLFQFYNPGPIFWICLAAIILGFTRIRNSLSWQVLLAWILPPLIFMSFIFNDSRTHAYTYMLPLFIVAGIGIDAFVGWMRPFFKGRSFQLVRASVIIVFLIFSYISYSIFIDSNPEYPWYPKHVLGMNFEGGFVAGTFGFPYGRDLREIGNWFQKLPDNGDLLMVSNEKRQIMSFYIPSKIHYRAKYSLPDFPKEVSAPHGIYIVIIQGPQTWTKHLWGLSLDEWHERFAPVQDFYNDEGQVVASIYYLTQEQVNAEFP
jgi:4-amino-4-deoxy-L-arabinose transferase-like glycosyltransferase